MEISHIESWAATNNMRLNRVKSKEIILTARGKRGKLSQLPVFQFFETPTCAHDMTEQPTLAR